MTLKFENPGYVYILSNESLKGLKIGYTQNCPYDRSADLYTTGVPTEFVVEKFFFVEDAPLCEELVHNRLTRHRISESREFFRIELDKAVRVVEQAIDDLRERLWSKNELKNNNIRPASVNNSNADVNHKNETGTPPPLVNQFAYNNPKFKEMMKVLKESKPMMTVEDIAKAIKISPAGVDKLITMMGKQQGVMLYTREENRVKKYAMALSFNVQQLTLLSEKYPDLQLMDLKELFEKPKNNNNYKNNGYKPKGDYKPKAKTGDNDTPRKFIENKLNNENLQAAGIKGDLTPAIISKGQQLLEESRRSYSELMKSDDKKSTRIIKPS